MFQQGHLPWEITGVYKVDYLSSADQEIPDWVFKITSLGDAETAVRLGIFLVWWHGLNLSDTICGLLFLLKNVRKRISVSHRSGFEIQLDPFPAVWLQKNSLNSKLCKVHINYAYYIVFLLQYYSIITIIILSLWCLQFISILPLSSLCRHDNFQYPEFTAQPQCTKSGMLWKWKRARINKILLCRVSLC